MSEPTGGREPGGAVSLVYAHLRTRIVNGEIPPGTKINIESVARSLEVSQTPVRETLQKLEADGLLDYSPGRGYMTTPVLDAEGLESLFELRFLIEPWSTRVVAEDRITNPGRRLRAELERFEAEISEGGDLRQLVLAHDSRFHGLILKATGNPNVCQAFEQSQAHLHLFRLSPVDRDGQIALREHTRIVEAIADCDPDAAEEAMRAHLQQSYERSAHVFDSESLGGLKRANAYRAHRHRILR